nr:immunoglobulin light chain junction region [Macaca mulatta]MOV65892.1 immunoglobulin light chain junction region [Macaca mulatta]MOV66566.1 immunoglobulin light chain junction region [Macaca mulatta]MOV67135.1 immunoglobulin light chain junction region [Macaca mulatta]MOV67151.1 immunoglobulin light chain junction region [Macaca mulatta]
DYYCFSTDTSGNRVF